MFVSPVVKSIVGGVGVTAAAVTTYLFTAKGDDHTAETRALADKANEECGIENTLWTNSYIQTGSHIGPVINNKNQRNNKGKTYDEWVSCRSQYYNTTQTASAAKAK